MIIRNIKLFSNLPLRFSGNLKKRMARAMPNIGPVGEEAEATPANIKLSLLHGMCLVGK